MSEVLTINENDIAKFSGPVVVSVEKFVKKSLAYSGEPFGVSGPNPYIGVKSKTNAIALSDMKLLAKMNWITKIEATKSWLYLYI